jgi:hypothetical protein
MAAVKTGDSGTASAPTARTNVFESGMPASPTTDYGNGGTATAARPNTRNPDPALFSQSPPTAPADPGSA